MKDKTLERKIADLLSEQLMIDRDTAKEVVQSDWHWIMECRSLGRYPKTIARDLVRRRGKTIREPDHVKAAKAVWKSEDFPDSLRDITVRYLAWGGDDDFEVVRFIVRHDLDLEEQRRLRDYYAKNETIRGFQTLFYEKDTD